MKLESVSIENFRCYQNKITVKVDDLTTLVGKNDSGKSSILEALEIFFNNDTVKIEQADSNICSLGKEVQITCEFSNLPKNLTLDAGAETTLQEEYLLTENGTLKIQKTYACDKSKVPDEAFILAHHPTAPGANNLLELKEKELQDIVKKKNLGVALKGNPGMRKAIWQSVEDLQLREVAIPVSKPKEDSKQIWEQIESHLPLFALFQSDRSSRDSDGEVQNPMKAAITAAIAEVQDDIKRIEKKVQEKAEEIANNTHAALKTIDENLAQKLSPKFTPPTPANWTRLFAINLNTDEGIPLNKRGSGVRRLVLVSFFKAEAERQLRTSNKKSIIYAIEDPETSQHPNNQRILIESFKTLATETNCQILLSTHSPGLASELPASSIRFITRDETGNPKIDEGVDIFGPVADALGLVPDSRVKVLFCVEGPTDVTAFKCMSRALHTDDPTIPDLSMDERVAFVVEGGATLKHWVDEHYLKALRLPEIHIYDNDVAKYGESIKAINDRGDGSWGALTSKHEIESYLHPDVIKDAFEVEIEVVDHLNAEGKAVPKIFAEAYSVSRRLDGTMGDTKAKSYLANRAFPLMTAAHIKERDPQGEVTCWFRKIGEMIQR